MTNSNENHSLYRSNRSTSEKTESTINQKKPKSLIIRISVALALVIIVVSLLIILVIIPNMKQNAYQQAMNDYNSKDFESAFEKFNNLGDYLNSQDMAIQSEMEQEYIEACSLFDEGSFVSAFFIFQDLGNFSDCEDMKHASAVKEASRLIENEENYEEALYWLAKSESNDSAFLLDLSSYINYDFKEYTYSGFPFASADMTFTLQQNGTCIWNITNINYTNKDPYIKYIGKWEGRWNPLDLSIQFHDFPLGDAWKIEPPNDSNDDCFEIASTDSNMRLYIKHPKQLSPKTPEQKLYDNYLNDREKDLYDRLYGNPYE